MRKLTWFFAGAVSVVVIYKLLLKNFYFQRNEHHEVNNWEGEGGAVFDIADHKKIKLANRNIRKQKQLHQPDQKKWHFPKKA